MKRLGAFLGVIIIFYIIGVIILNLPEKKLASQAPTEFGKPTPTQTSQSQTKLKSEDLTVGNGAEASTGDTVKVNYVGTLTNGKKFDSSYDRKEPFSFKLGSGEVIKGWDQGVVGMKIGGKRKLTIPPELAYSNQAQGTIPANSTLIFEIELLEVTKNTQNSQQPNLNL